MSVSQYGGVVCSVLHLSLGEGSVLFHGSLPLFILVASDCIVIPLEVITNPSEVFSKWT